MTALFTLVNLCNEVIVIDCGIHESCIISCEMLVEVGDGLDGYICIINPIINDVATKVLVFADKMAMKTLFNYTFK